MSTAEIWARSKTSFGNSSVFQEVERAAVECHLGGCRDLGALHRAIAALPDGAKSSIPTLEHALRLWATAIALSVTPAKRP